jgi:hypothetical protein
MSRIGTAVAQTSSTAAARAALIAEGLRIGLCELEVRLTIESAFRAGRERLDVLQAGCA